RKTRNPPGFSRVSGIVRRPANPDPKRISSESQDTSPTELSQAPHRPPTRQARPPRDGMPDVHRRQHPLRDRRPYPRSLSRGHRGDPRPRPADRTDRRHQSTPPPAQDPPPLP